MRLSRREKKGKERVGKIGVIQKIRKKALRDKTTRKELKEKRDMIKITEEWGSRWVTHEKLRNKRLQWLLVQVCEGYVSGRQGTPGGLDTLGTTEWVWHSKGSGGSGSFNLIEGLDTDLEDKGVWEYILLMLIEP